MLNKHYETDSLVKGVLLGLVCSALMVPSIGFVIPELLHFYPSGWQVVFTDAILMALVLIIPILPSLRKTGIWHEPRDVKADLLGRLIGIALGLLFGISLYD